MAAYMIWQFIIGLVSVGIAWAIRKLRPVILQVFIALIAPVFVSSLLAIVPELLEPSPSSENRFAWVWQLAAAWALVAVPVCLVSVIVFNYLHSRTGPVKTKKSSDRK